jgi:ribosomal protein S18 acetylase RimI-like enzyme
MKKRKAVKLVRVAKPSQKRKEVFRRFYNRIFWDSPWSKKKFNQFFTRNSVFINLAIKGKVAGIICGKRDPRNKKIFLVEALAVSPNYRGKNYGDKLMEELIKKVKKMRTVEKIVLHYRQSKKLSKYYKRFGFGNLKVIGKYKNREKKYQMDLKIK